MKIFNFFIILPVLIFISFNSFAGPKFFNEAGNEITYEEFKKINEKRITGNKIVPETESSLPKKKEIKNDNQNAPMPTYDVVDRDTNDSPIKTQIILHAVVSGTITELGLKKLLQKLYYEANATRGFKYHGGKPTHVFIYLYTSKDHFKSGMGQWIAMLSKIGEGSRAETQVETELIAQLDAKPEFKYGLPESKRKEIFKSAVMNERRADTNAQRMCPYIDRNKPGYSKAKAIEQIKKQVQMRNTLMEKYDLEVAERYGITQERLRNITVEGLTKNWPIP